MVKIHEIASFILSLLFTCQNSLSINKYNISEMQQLNQQSCQQFHGPNIDLSVIFTQKIFEVHNAQFNGQKKYAKVFSRQVIDNYQLMETMRYNVEIFTQSINFQFPNNFLHIETNSLEGQAIVFITEKYSQRLDQYIKRKGPSEEPEALKIYQQILKAVFSLIEQRYFHRNIRAEHFVLVDQTWKLETIVYEQIYTNDGENISYRYNPDYQPPEAYDEGRQFSPEQLNQRMVWDLGCILIHLLLGNHKLRNYEILEKFKGEPFSFKKIGANIYKKLNPKLQQIIGKMCHYNQKDRLTLKQLLLSDFFSKQVQMKYSQMKSKMNGSPKDNLRISTKRNLNTSTKSNKPIDFIGANEIADSIRNSQDSEIIRSLGKSNKIQSCTAFKTNIKQIVQSQQKRFKKGQPITTAYTTSNNPEQIDTQSSINQIIQVYKNYLDKGDILAIGGQKFDQMLSLFKNQNQGKQLIQLTMYALHFVRCMDLNKLVQSMNANRIFFKVDSTKWYHFHGSDKYQGLKKLVNKKKKQADICVANLKQQLIKKKNSIMTSKKSISKFVNNCLPQNSTFIDIKQSYRLILKQSYDKIADHYSRHKTPEWARLGMYITYCLAIDKLYIEKQFQDNFKYFFQYSHQTPGNYVQLDDFQKYLNNGPKEMLVENSKFIIEKFYDLEKKNH